jgi:hypothetical protein
VHPHIGSTMPNNRIIVTMRTASLAFVISPVQGVPLPATCGALPRTSAPTWHVEGPLAVHNIFRMYVHRQPWIFLGTATAILCHRIGRCLFRGLRNLWVPAHAHPFHSATNVWFISATNQRIKLCIGWCQFILQAVVVLNTNGATHHCPLFLPSVQMSISALSITSHMLISPAAQTTCAVAYISNKAQLCVHHSNVVVAVHIMIS